MWPADRAVGGVLWRRAGHLLSSGGQAAAYADRLRALAGQPTSTDHPLRILTDVCLIPNVWAVSAISTIVGCILAVNPIRTKSS
jgi:hypothetical protein